MMSELVGRKIVEIRPMTNEEMSSEYWDTRDNKPTVIVLDDGTKLYPSRDEEGNGPGCLFGMSQDGRNFALL